MKKVTLILMMSILLCMTGCGDNDNKNDNTDESNYAQNDTGSTTETTTVDKTDSTTETTTEEWIPSVNNYNVVDDINANASLTNNTVSIDGKIMTFPCTYNDIVDKFGQLYTVQQDISTNVDESMLVTEIEVQATPTTGTGIIKFMLTSTIDKEDSISNCICNKFTVVGITTTTDKLMTIALPGNIKFGSTVEDIAVTYGKVYNKYDNNDRGNFSITYTPDGTKNRYYFYGSNYGLYQVIFDYNE